MPKLKVPNITQSKPSSCFAAAASAIYKFYEVVGGIYIIVTK